MLMEKHDLCEKGVIKGGLGSQEKNKGTRSNCFDLKNVIRNLTLSEFAWYTR